MDLSLQPWRIWIHSWFQHESRPMLNILHVETTNYQSKCTEFCWMFFSHEYLSRAKSYKYTTEGTGIRCLQNQFICIHISLLDCQE